MGSIKYGLFEAAWMLASDRAMGRRFADLYIRSKDAITLEELTELSELQTAIEEELRCKLMSGELIATWFPSGRTVPEAIHSEWWRRARFKLWRSEADLDDTRATDITVSKPLTGAGGSKPASEIQELSAQPAPRKRRGWAESDALLKGEWDALVKCGAPPYTAAQQLAPKAKGGGTVESRAKRLHDRFTR